MNEVSNLVQGCSLTWRVGKKFHGLGSAQATPFGHAGKVQGTGHRAQDSGSGRRKGILHLAVVLAPYCLLQVRQHSPVYCLCPCQGSYDQDLLVNRSPSNRRLWTFPGLSEGRDIVMSLGSRLGRRRESENQPMYRVAIDHDYASCSSAVRVGKKGYSRELPVLRDQNSHVHGHVKSHCSIHLSRKPCSCFALHRTIKP